ncbi:calcium/sodium antiporter [bacterium]|nr:calcium/sodium antiporter [bacterium]
MIKEILLFILGLVFLIGGGELMVRGAVALSKILSLSAMVIGIVIVGFGTSVPELMASLFAVLGNANSPELHFGNIIGSNIANILLILGLTAVINPIIFPAKPSKRDIAFLVLSLVLLGIGFLKGKIFWWYGAIMAFAMIAYIVWRLKKPEGNDDEIPELSGLFNNFYFSLFVTVIGIAIMIGSAKLMVESAVKMAQFMGVSNTFIGLTIVAVGTSLPELTASIMSALHKRSDMAVGNIIGSNIFNILLIPGITAIAYFLKDANVNKFVEIKDNTLLTDLGIMAVVTLVFIAFAYKRRIGRIAGVTFLIAYAAYTTYTYLAAK